MDLRIARLEPYATRRCYYLLMVRIFISYRRNDTGGHARWLGSLLAAHFGEAQIFFDESKIKPGQDWPTEIKDNLDACEVLLAVIGPDWLSAQNPKTYQRRLDEPKDWVRLEVEAGLKNKRVIPVLVGGAELPPAEAMPQSIQALVSKQTAEIRHERDVRHLIEIIGALTPSPQANTRTYLEALWNDTAYLDIRGLKVSGDDVYGV